MSQISSFTHSGQKFHMQQWLHPTPDAILCIVHGHGEHIGRYDHIAKFLGESKISTMGFDLYGHGKTVSKKGHWPSYEAVLDSIEQLIEQARQANPEKPIFLYGHSMGGNLVANFALRRQTPLAGLILSAPWFRLGFTPSSTDLFLAKMMLNIYPSFTQSSKLDASGISRDPKEVEKYVNDPLVHDLISPVMFTSTYQAGHWALEHAAELSIPTLHFHGDADEITSFEASQEFASKVEAGYLTFRPFEGYFHELHNESPEHRAPVLDLMREWILSQIK